MTTKNANQIQSGRSGVVATGIVTHPPFSSLPLLDIKHIFVSYSGGKDSTASLLACVEMFGKDRVTALFADTGAESPESYQYMKWFNENVHPLLRLSQRIVGQKETKQGTQNVLENIALSWDDPVGAQGAITFERLVLQRKERRPDTAGWPSKINRFCTKSLKQQVLAKHIRHATKFEERLNALQVIGLRRDESDQRAGTPDFMIDPDAQCWNWYPIAAWSDLQTARYVHDSGVLLNPDYRVTKRVGCVNCFFSSHREIVARMKAAPELFLPFIKLEGEVGSWKKDKSLSELQSVAESGRGVEQLSLWGDNEPLTCSTGFCDTGTGLAIPANWIWSPE